MEKFNNIGLSRELTSCYDFQGFTEQEVWSRIAQKINIIIEHFNYLDKKIENEKDNNKAKFDYLLGEGLNESVSKVIIQKITDGTIGELINGTLLKGINDKVDTFQQTFTEQLDNIDNNLSKIENNVSQYGVVGDGITDDTEALQIALNNSLNSRLKLDKSLTVRITNTIIVPESVELNFEGDVICDGDVDYWFYGINNKKVIINNINGKIIKLFSERTKLNRFFCLENHDYFEVVKCFIEGASNAIHGLNGNTFRGGLLEFKNILGTEAQYGYGLNISAKICIVDDIIVYNDSSENGRHMLYINGASIDYVKIKNIKVTNCNKNPINIYVTDVNKKSNIFIDNVDFDTVNVNPLTTSTGAINLANENGENINLFIQTYNNKNTNSCILSDLSASNNANIDIINVFNVKASYAENGNLVYFRNGSNKKINKLYCTGLATNWLSCVYARDTSKPVIGTIVLGGNEGGQCLRLSTAIDVGIGTIVSSIDTIYSSGSTYFFTNAQNKIYYNDGVGNEVGKLGDIVKRTTPRIGDCIGWVYTDTGSWEKYGQVSNRTCSGNPNNVIVPYFTGEEILDTTNSKWYKSISTAIGGWRELTATL